MKSYNHWGCRELHFKNIRGGLSNKLGTESILNKKIGGITIISLVITIVVLLILSGVTVAILTGDNGIIRKATEAKEQSEISEEKEIVELSVIQAMKNGNITKSKLSQSLHSYVGEDKTKIYKHEQSLVVVFTKSNRVYLINKEGTVEVGNIDIQNSDIAPGKLEGSGTQDEPFIINSVEDLVFFSQDTNSGNQYSGKYVELGKDLNLQSELSYQNPNTTEYNEFLGINGNISLIDALTNKEYSGFIPITGFLRVF